MKKVFSIILTIILVSTIFSGILFLSEDASAATYVSGIYTTDKTWTSANSPYVVIDELLVDNGTTLTIEPGVTVKFDGKYSLVVNGTLNATGTAAKPIIFTSNQSAPLKGDWDRIRLHGKNNTMHYCEISFGNYPLYIMGENTNNSISHCILYDNDGDGIYLKKTTNNTLDNVTVITSYSNGITLLVSENNIINNSHFELNRAFGIYLRSSNNNTIINTNVSGNKGGGIEFGLINHNIKIRNVSVFQNMDNGIDLNGNDYINITDSRIIGNDGNGIDFGGPSVHQWIENCTINENKKSGIYLQRAAYSDIVGCFILRNKGSAGIFSDKKVENLNITKSKILENSEDGIELYEAKFVNITDSNIHDNGYNGIIFNGSEIQENNIIQNCTIVGNYNNGIYFYVYSSSSTSIIQNNNISYNTINSNLQNGIYFEGKLNLNYYNNYNTIIQYNHIFNNTIFSNDNNGICFKTSLITNFNYDSYIQYNNIFNNTIYFNFQNGIFFDTYVYDDRSYILYNNIHNNTIYSNFGNGICFFIEIQWARSYVQYNNIFNNTIHSNDKNGILFDMYPFFYYEISYQYNNIFSNIIYSNMLNGIFFNSSVRYYRSYIDHNCIFKNTIHSNGQNGIYFSSVIYEEHFKIEYNNIYSNQIYSNKKNGIHFYGYSSITQIYDPSRFSSYIQFNNIYLNKINSNNQNGIKIRGNTRNGLLYLQNNVIHSNLIYLNAYGSGIYARTDNVSVKLQNSNIYNNTLDSNLIGIEFLRIKSHIANINNITNSFSDGIRLNSSTENIIGYNLIANNKENGLNLRSESNNNRIQNNNITLNSQYGIYVNTKSNGNTIIRNDIINNPGVGVNITGATDNYLHHNNFKYNTQNAYDSTTQLNDWDDGTEGNWWDDYTGFDSNNDGIGDIPYDIPGGGSKDWYPIIKPANITAPRIENTTPEDGELDVSVNTKISITFTNKMNRTATEPAISISGGLTPKNFIWSNGDMTVTFELSSTLSSETSYTVTVLLTAKDVLENHLENTYKFSFTSEDIIPPKIISTSPVHYATDVELNASVVVTFSEPMNSTTLSYYCSPDPGGWSIEWSKKNAVATFEHKDFGSLTSYTFRITGGKDRGGNELVSGPVANPWQFTTKDVVGPEITTTSPANGSVNVQITADIVVTFNEQMNTSSVNYSCKPDPGGWKVVWSNGDRTMTFSHYLFTSQTTYTFHISAGKDIAGNALNPSLPNPWSFSTSDTVPPKIIATSPVNNSYSVPLKAQIIVIFDEAMDNTTITYICNPNPGGWAVSWSGGNTVATYSHNSFKENTNYTFHITSGKDIAGNNLVAGNVPNPWVFSTLDYTAPIIIATTPTNGTIDIELNAKIVATFSEPMNVGTVAYTCAPDPGGWTVKWSNSNTIATFSHNSFNSTTKYTFQITAAKDLSGNPLMKSSTPNPWVFTTKDAIGPTIISVSPQNGATEVAITANVVITFSEPMDTSTVTFTCSPNPSGWTTVWSAGNTVASCMHDLFERSTTYTFQITSGQDLAHNTLAPGTVPNPWVFTTVINIPPIILSDPLTDGTEEIEYVYDVEAYDANNDEITYILTFHPNGMTIHNSTGKISWVPTNAQVGRALVEIFVSDGKGGFDTQTFNITVKNVNDPPNIISIPITLATEDKHYSYHLDAVDIDAADILVFSFELMPTGMNINSASGLITWVPTNDQVGLNSVMIRVDDGNGGTDTQSFVITTINVNDPPNIVTEPIIIGTEDEKYNYDVDALDIDLNDTISYSLTTKPEGMIIDAGTGLITWLPNNDQVGAHSVAIKVSDKFDGTATQTFTISVANVNDPPVITSSPITSAFEDLQYFYDVDAEDIDPTEDELTFSLSVSPAGMEIDPNTGIITWTPTNDQIGLHNVAILVSDGADGTDSQVFIVGVIAINDPPIIISTPVTTATEDEQYTYDVDALDDDIDDIITYTLEKYPEGMVIDGMTGMITWTPTNEQVGVSSVSVKVTDRIGESTRQSFSITVENVNNPPVITSTPGTTAIVDNEYVYDISAVDIDPTNDELTFSLTSKPEGMNINPTTGVITWVPTKAHKGSNYIEVIVSDNNKGSNRQSFTITVEPTETPEKETTQKTGTEQAAEYSLVVFILILTIIFVIILVSLFRKEKPRKKEN